jgi:hypothetical protein
MSRDLDRTGYFPPPKRSTPEMKVVAVIGSKFTYLK